MINKLKITLIILSLALVSACDEKKDDPREKYSYNAFFEYGDKKIYVGTVTGLSSCKYVVSSFYAKRRTHVKGEWDYICCLRVGDNNCAERNRYND